MDLKRSTAAGLRLSTRKLDRFNLALVNQLQPHLQAVGLEHVRIKFTGDGWLLMSNNSDHAAPLCCLAVIMATRFQHEIAEQAHIALDSVPAMRLAVCWARDLEVELPDGQRDFVGDSVRHAVRACQLCEDNEILIDETVQRWIHHDFVTERIDMVSRLEAQPYAKWEQDLALHSLMEMRVESAAESDAPVYFVNTLSIIGRGGEAEALADRIADRLQEEAEAPDANQAALRDRFNRLLGSSLDYDAASRILKDMQEAGLPPDEETFNTLILKAGHYSTQCIWMQRMRQRGLKPSLWLFNTLLKQSRDDQTRRKWLARMKRERIQLDTATLNTLIDRSPDIESASAWLDALAEDGVQPDVSTYDLLIEKSPDVRPGMKWVERMFAAGIQPGIVTYLALFSKDLSGIGADELLAWYLRQPYHPSVAMDRAMAAYRRLGRIDDALRLAMDYPYTQAAQRIIRAHPERSLVYFQTAVDDNPRHPNGTYALGIALTEFGRIREAEMWLERARDLASPGPRHDEVTRLLDRLRSKPDNFAVAEPLDHSERSLPVPAGNRP